VLDSPTHNPTARVIHGFTIHAETLKHLDPLERAWAKKYIAEGIWRLVDNDGGAA